MKKEVTISLLKDWFKDSSDIVFKTKFSLGKKPVPLLEFLYCPNLLDTKFMNEAVLPRIMESVENDPALPMELVSSLMEVSQLKDSEKIKYQVEQKLFSGELVIFQYETNELFATPLSNMPKRSPEESNLETSVRGPRDGFVESIEDNLALVRHRLKTSSFKSIEFTIGERSKTKVLLLYLEDILNPDILEDVKRRLGSINVDILNSSNQLEEMLYDHPFSIFPLMDYIGRPDFVVASVNQGRFAILVDGSPSCLIGPVHLVQLAFSPEDINNSFFYISFVRFMRIIALITTAYLPGFFIALITFQTEQLPYSLLATISVTRLGLPLSAPMEAFIMLTLFELFKEAGLRLPKAVGQTVAVLGGLIIGDAAIRAGLTSPSMLVVISITVISGYTLINQNIAGNVVILRYFVLILSATLGLYGFFISFFIITLLVFSLESFGQPYTVIFAKPNLADSLKTVIKLPLQLLTKRNQAYNPTDTTRQKE